MTIGRATQVRTPSYAATTLPKPHANGTLVQIIGIRPKYVIRQQVVVAVTGKRVLTSGLRPVGRVTGMGRRDEMADVPVGVVHVQIRMVGTPQMTIEVARTL